VHEARHLDALPLAARCVNVKPSRVGALRSLFELYAHCEAGGLGMYGGGMGELGVGRGQIQLLASIFHPDAPNDVAPGGWNLLDPPAGLPSSPLVPGPRPTGLRWGTGARATWRVSGGHAGVGGLRYGEGPEIPGSEVGRMVKVGLYVRLKAAEGREDDVADFLRQGQQMVQEEPGTTVWYALKLDEGTFAIFDAFEDDEGRDAHLNGAVAQALGDNADMFAEEPSIHQVEVLASK